jgi:4-amino-4-deoxy-L-arabinose transferase-like glycosyltransferase
LKGSWNAGRGRINRAAAAGIFVLSLLLCVSFAYFAKPLPVTDEFLTYYRIATNVSDGKGFTEDGSRPYVYLPPLFSCALGGWFTLVGSRSIFAVQVYQSLCLALSALLTFFLARELFPRSGKAAVAASLWVAVHPSLWTYAVFVRQEPTILLLTTLACWRTVIWLNEPARVRAILAGICWGLATLAKSVTLFLPVFLLFLWAWRGRRDGRMKGLDAALAVISFLLVLAPWTARNYLQFHRFIPVNDQAAGVLEWNVRQSDAPADEGMDWARLLIAQLKTKDPAKGELAGEKYLAELDRAGVRDKERGSRLWNYILSHKKYFVVQRVRNAIFFAAPGVDWWIQSGRLKAGEAQGSGPFLAIALLSHGILYLFFFWRLFLLARGRLGFPMTFLVLFFTCYWGIYTLLWGEIRFSIPVYPVLILFAPWERIFKMAEAMETDRLPIGGLQA